MADDDDFDDELEKNEDDTSDNSGRKYQRKLENERRDLKADNASKDALIKEGLLAQKELAFLRAGIDTTKGGGKLLFKSYEGDLTADAIMVVAQEYDLVPTSQKEEVKEEIAQLREVSQASSGSGGGVAPTVFDEIKATKTPEQALALARKLGVPISYETPGEMVSLF